VPSFVPTDVSVSVAPTASPSYWAPSVADVREENEANSLRVDALRLLNSFGLETLGNFQLEEIVQHVTKLKPLKKLVRGLKHRAGDVCFFNDKSGIYPGDPERAARAIDGSLTGVYIKSKHKNMYTRLLTRGSSPAYLTLNSSHGGFWAFSDWVGPPYRLVGPQHANPDLVHSDLQPWYTPDVMAKNQQWPSFLDAASLRSPFVEQQDAKMSCISTLVPTAAPSHAPTKVDLNPPLCTLLHVRGPNLPQISGASRASSDFDYSFVIPGRYKLVVTDSCYYACYKNVDANVYLNFFPGMEYWYFSATLNQPPFLLFGEQGAQLAKGYHHQYPAASMFGLIHANWQTANGDDTKLEVECAGPKSEIQEDVEVNITEALKNPMQLLNGLPKKARVFHATWDTPDCKAVSLQFLRHRFGDSSTFVPCMGKYLYMDKVLMKKTYDKLDSLYSAQPIYYMPRTQSRTEWFMYYNPHLLAWVVSQKVGLGPYCVKGRKKHHADTADSVKYKVTWPGPSWKGWKHLGTKIKEVEIGIETPLVGSTNLRTHRHQHQRRRILEARNPVQDNLVQTLLAQLQPTQAPHITQVPSAAPSSSQHTPSYGPRSDVGTKQNPVQDNLVQALLAHLQETQAPSIAPSAAPLVPSAAPSSAQHPPSDGSRSDVGATKKKQKSPDAVPVYASCASFYR
jgi:hypothetical protein